MKKSFPIVTIVVSGVSIFCSLIVFLNPELFSTLCFRTRPEHVWQYVSGSFIHVIEPRFAFWIQLIMNCMGLIPMGILVEKEYGSLRIGILMLSEMIVSAIVFQLVTWNYSGEAAGISAIMYAVGTVGFYVLFKRLKSERKAFWKKFSSFYFTFIGLGMVTNIAPMMSIVSLVMHLSGILVGIGFITLDRFVWKKDTQY